MRLQLWLNFGEEYAPLRMSGDTDHANNLVVHERDVGAQRVPIGLTVKFNNVIRRRPAPAYCRRTFSTDWNSAIAASKVQGFGLSACKHILESSSHSPPNAKSSS